MRLAESIVIALNVGLASLNLWTAGRTWRLAKDNQQLADLNRDTANVIEDYVKGLYK